jgi:Holliday junction DNA helicase RuvA
LDLYGFLTEKELLLFESLIGVSGVGPRSGLNIMAVASISQLIAAINEGRADLLSKAGGVGRKTAERITLELKGKLAFSDSEKSINMMESDIDLEETLVGLGFSRANARNAISKIGSEITDFNERLKIALKHK